MRIDKGSLPSSYVNQMERGRGTRGRGSRGRGSTTTRTAVRTPSHAVVTPTIVLEGAITTVTTKGAITKETHYSARTTPPPPGDLPMPNLPTRGRRKPGPITTGTKQLPSSDHTSGVTGTWDETQLMQAILRAEQRGGSVALLPTSGLPVWMCFRQHRFQLHVHSVLGGMWCENCEESIGERVVRLHLERIGIDYRCEVSFPSLVHLEPLRFDFYIPSLRLFIEMDGEQHFGPAPTFKGTLLDRLVKDQLKDDWVRKEGFSLLRIGYWELAGAERLIDSIIARLRAGESALLVCWEAIVEWRKKAIKVLQSRHRAPPAPVPEDAKRMAQDARRARKDDMERCTELTSASHIMPTDIVVSLA